MQKFSSLLVLTGCASIDDDIEGVRDTKNEEVNTPLDSIEIDTLRNHILEQGVYTPEPGDVRPFSDPLVKLGQKLFFDKIVSGNSDTSCDLSPSVLRYERWFAHVNWRWWRRDWTVATSDQ